MRELFTSLIGLQEVLDLTPRNVASSTASDARAKAHATAKTIRSRLKGLAVEAYKPLERMNAVCKVYNGMHSFTVTLFFECDCVCHSL